MGVWLRSSTRRRGATGLPSWLLPMGTREATSTASRSRSVRSWSSSLGICSSPALSAAYVGRKQRDDEYVANDADDAGGDGESNDDALNDDDDEWSRHEQHEQPLDDVGYDERNGS